MKWYILRIRLKEPNQGVLVSDLRVTATPDKGRRVRELVVLDILDLVLHNQLKHTK